LNNGEKQASITLVKDSDIICGRSRGSLALKHPGNKSYRRIVCLNKQLYATAVKTDKLRISESIVAAIREIDGRFLEREDGKRSTSLNEKDDHGNPVTWRDIGDKKSTEKTSQALREGQPKLLKLLAQSQGVDVLPQATNMTNVTHTGVAPPFQPQRMPQFGHDQVQGVVLEVQHFGPQPPSRNSLQDQQCTSFTCSSLAEGQAFSAFPRNSFVENSAPPSGDHSNSCGSAGTIAVDNLRLSILSIMSISMRSNESCGGEESMPLPYRETDNGTDGHMFSTDQQQQLMSCLSVCGEGRSQHVNGESATIITSKRPSITSWQLASLRTSMFSLSFASKISELSLCCDDLSLDSAMDALEREAVFDTIEEFEAGEISVGTSESPTF